MVIASHTTSLGYRQVVSHVILALRVDVFHSAACQYSIPLDASLGECRSSWCDRIFDVEDFIQIGRSSFRPSSGK